MKWELLASSSTLEGIKGSIKRFYCGEGKEVSGENVIGSKGIIEGVRVILKRGRYRFEMLI
jgi:hypothetical protein